MRFGRFHRAHKRRCRPDVLITTRRVLLLRRNEVQTRFAIRHKSDEKIAKSYQEGVQKLLAVKQQKKRTTHNALEL